MAVGRELRDKLWIVFTNPLTWPLVKEGAQDELLGGGAVPAFPAPEEPASQILRPIDGAQKNRSQRQRGRLRRSGTGQMFPAHSFYSLMENSIR